MPVDASKLARKIIDIATGEEQEEDDGKDPAAVALGRKGGRKGGKARGRHGQEAAVGGGEEGGRGAVGESLSLQCRLNYSLCSPWGKLGFHCALTNATQ